MTPPDLAQNRRELSRQEGVGDPPELTPSVPWCHLKTTIKSAKLETLQPFCFLCRTGM